METIPPSVALAKYTDDVRNTSPYGKEYVIILKPLH
jgi:hypothetical protein